MKRFGTLAASLLVLLLAARPAPGAPFYGQDARHDGNRPSYRDNGDAQGHHPVA